MVLLCENSVKLMYPFFKDLPYYSKAGSKLSKPLILELVHPKQIVSISSYEKFYVHK